MNKSGLDKYTVTKDLDDSFSETVNNVVRKIAESKSKELDTKVWEAINNKYPELLAQAVQEALAKQKEEILAWVGEHLFYEDGGGVEGLDHNFVKTDDLETYLKGEK